MSVNVSQSFQSTFVLQTGLSDFHLITLTVTRKSLKNLQLRIIINISKIFTKEKFKNSLLNELREEELINNNKILERFCYISMKYINENATRKKRTCLR